MLGMNKFNRRSSDVSTSESTRIDINYFLILQFLKNSTLGEKLTLLKSGDLMDIESDTHVRSSVSYTANTYRGKRKQIPLFNSLGRMLMLFRGRKQNHLKFKNDSL
ncbi:hypothetical protein TNCV_4893691 [Trichonephila clavipes]|nr:hypothetical protein TNCV_4893691 [Trichonephila clavipes]